MIRSKECDFPANGWANVNAHGFIHVHPTRIEEPECWAYVLAHCMLHLGLGHCKQKPEAHAWGLACEITVMRFLEGLRLGAPPPRLAALPHPREFTLPGGNEEELYEHFRRRNDPLVPSYSLTASTAFDFTPEEKEPQPSRRFLVHKETWEDAFAEGLQNAVASAVATAGGYEQPQNKNALASPTARNVARAREWFLNRYPLLGALAASFEIIVDPTICRQGGIHIAAVNAYARELYVNPASGLSEAQCRFVIAHELLHVALRHQARAQARDPYLWNVAADYVINGWLIEMNVGDPPEGVLIDTELAGLSAESVYDRIGKDLRRLRKLATLRGTGVGDMLDDCPPRWWESGQGVDLDAFYRSALAQGLALHETQGRGLLPAGLIEEIKALSQPPIPWDVALARWIDGFISPLDSRRTYARLSRRQSAAPHIPLPRYVRGVPDPARTFGVIVDTSGSMSRVMLGESLGAIASYAQAREVPAVRMISCDAAPYDHGYIATDTIADRITLRGRGGTLLQPGIELLENAADFPKDGPILIITDGVCDAFTSRRKHAILLPEGRAFPYATGNSTIFRFSERA